MSAGRLNLGELIDALKDTPAHNNIRFNFGNFWPAGIDSYRGYYADLAVGYSGEFLRDYTTQSLILSLETGLGMTFEGYKGGNYVMERESRLWVANRGVSTGTTITGVVIVDYETVIMTGYDS